jgi:hypothetical protein
MQLIGQKDPGQSLPNEKWGHAPYQGCGNPAAMHTIGKRGIERMKVDIVNARDLNEER